MINEGKNQIKKMRTLITDQGEIQGEEIYWYTGNQKRKVAVKFWYDEGDGITREYHYTFSRKTGKPYGWTPDFNIRLVVE